MIKKLLLVASIIFVSFFNVNQVTAANYEAELEDFENLALFSEYARARLNICYLSDSNSLDQALAENDFLYKNGINNKTDFCANKKNVFERRLKMIYGLHLYGESGVISDSATTNYSSIFSIYDSIIAGKRKPGQTYNSNGSLAEQALTASNAGHSDLLVKSQINDFLLYNDSLASFDNVETFFQQHSPKLMLAHLNNSCKQYKRLCNKDNPDPNYCYCNQVVAEDGKNYFLSSSLNRPDYLQQMYWNSISNYSQPDIVYDYKNTDDDHIKLLNYVEFTNKELAEMRQVIDITAIHGDNLTQYDFKFEQPVSRGYSNQVPGGLGALVKFLARVSIDVAGFIFDKSVEMISNTPKSVNNSQLKSVWSNFRNLTNIILVLAFIFVIFSQLTGFGLSNYSAKKMLPKLLISIITINLSFTIILLATDLSNILADSILSLLSATSLQTISGKVVQNQLVSIIGTGGLTFFIAEILFLIVALFVSIINLILLVIISSIRKILIVLVIILAPLAFISNALPKFKKLYQTWWSMLSTALIIPPTLSLVYGVSLVAFSILSKDNYIVAITVLSAMSVYGVFHIIKLLRMVPMIVSVPIVSRILSLKPTSAPGFIKDKVINPLIGQRVTSNLKARQTRKMADLGSKKRYANIAAPAMKQLISSYKQKSANYTSKSDITELINSIDPTKRRLSSQKDWRANLSKVGQANMIKEIRDSNSSLTALMSALHALSRSDDGSPVDFDYRDYLIGAQKARRLGASPEELKDLFFGTLGNLEQQNNLFGMAELSYNYSLYSGQNGYYNPDQDYAPANKEARTKAFADIFNHYDIVGLNAENKVEKAINYDMLTKGQRPGEYLSILSEITSRDEYSKIKKNIESQVHLVDAQTRSAFADIGLESSVELDNS